MITGRQIRAARALLGLTGQELADKCSISLKTLRRYEPQDGVPNGSSKVLETIENTLVESGVEFVGDSENPGVKLKAK